MMQIGDNKKTYSKITYDTIYRKQMYITYKNTIPCKIMFKDLLRYYVYTKYLSIYIIDKNVDLLHILNRADYTCYSARFMHDLHLMVNGFTTWYDIYVRHINSLRPNNGITNNNNTYNTVIENACIIIACKIFLKYLNRNCRNKVYIIARIRVHCI